MTEPRTSWKPGKKDALFLGVIVLVITLLVIGSGERTTRPTPDDEVHRAAPDHEVCLTCHGAEGVRPQPVGHVGGDQCFQCHTQPRGWKGGAK